MAEVLFRLGDLPQEVQNIIITFMFLLKHPIHLTRERSTVMDCDKCYVAHDSPKPLTANALTQLLRVSRCFNEVGQVALFKKNVFVMSDIITRCDLRRHLQEVPRLRQIQNIEMKMGTAISLGLPILGAMKDLKLINIVHDSVIIVRRPPQEVSVGDSIKRLGEILVPKAIAKYWRTQDTFDLFLGVRLRIEVVYCALDEASETEEAAKPLFDYFSMGLDLLPNNNTLGLKLQRTSCTTLGKSAEASSVSESRSLVNQ